MGKAFPRTVRPGMLNGLTPEMLRAMGLSDHDSDGGREEQQEREGRQSGANEDPDLERGQSYHIAKMMQGVSDNRQGHSPEGPAVGQAHAMNAQGEEIPVDMRVEDSRPIPRVMPEHHEDGDHDRMLSSDARSERMRPIPGMARQSRQQSNNRSSSRYTTSSGKENKASTLSRQQASELDRREGGKRDDDPRNDQDVELRNSWSK